MAIKFTFVSLFIHIILFFSPFVLAAETKVPFDYEVKIISTFRGPNMKSSNGRFCNTFKSHGKLKSQTEIQLYRDVRFKRDIPYQAYYYPNDGKKHKHCWIPQSPDKAY